MCYSPMVRFACCRHPPEAQRRSIQGRIPITRQCRLAGKSGHDLHTVSDDFTVTYPLKCSACTKKFTDEWDAYMRESWTGANEEHTDYGHLSSQILKVFYGARNRSIALKDQFGAAAELAVAAWWADIKRLDHRARPDKRLERPHAWRIDYDNYANEYQRVALEFTLAIANILGDE